MQNKIEQEHDKRSVIKENTFSLRVKLLHEPWCETDRSAGRAIIRISASLIKRDSRSALHGHFTAVFLSAYRWITTAFAPCTVHLSTICLDYEY